MKGFALVRDGNGNPVFDDYFDILPEIAQALTTEDLKYIEDIKNGHNTLDSNTQSNS